MESEKNQVETQTPKSESAEPVSASSCYKVKYDGKEGFTANLRNQYTVFVNTPMAEHKACFKNTYAKVILVALLYKIEVEKEKQDRFVIYVSF